MLDLQEVAQSIKSHVSRLPELEPGDVRLFCDLLDEIPVGDAGRTLAVSLYRRTPELSAYLEHLISKYGSLLDAEVQNKEELEGRLAPEARSHLVSALGTSRPSIDAVNHQLMQYSDYAVVRKRTDSLRRIVGYFEQMRWVLNSRRDILTKLSEVGNDWTE